MMETSVKPVEVLMQPGATSSSMGDQSPDSQMAAAMVSPPLTFGASEPSDPMKEFHQRLEDIIRSSTTNILEQGTADAETETKAQTVDDITLTVETEVSVMTQSLNSLSSPEEKLEDLLHKYTELATLRHSEKNQRCALQRRVSLLTDECRRGAEARKKLEALCRELQTHYGVLREETVQRCREDEEKRKEISSHFQKTMTEIQAQIDQQSTRNANLCHENANLTEKLEGLMNQCELREESLEKITHHRDLQHKLTEAKLQQANALLADATEKHKREKEYLLVQAAEWKLQAQTLAEQGAVMQAQLALYAQKFDEFQATLAKSNEIYVRFKQQMNEMTDKMKRVEKESDLWKMRFENCNKALTDMTEERSEKSKEFDLFVLKIQKLEKLCRTLQDERQGLYNKIKDVRQATFPTKVITEAAGTSLLFPTPEVQELQDEDSVLTEDMARLKEEQAKLQLFAASLLDTSIDNEVEDEVHLDEDIMASAFIQFKSKPSSVDRPPEEAGETKSETADSVPAQDGQKPDGSRSEEHSESTSKHEAPSVEISETEEVQQPVSVPDPVKADPQTDPEPPPEKTVLQEPEDTPEVQADNVKVQQPVSVPDPVKADPQTDPEQPPEKTVLQEPEDISEVQADNVKVQQPVSVPDPVKADPQTDPEPPPEKTVLQEPEDTSEVQADNVKVQQPVSVPDPVKVDPQADPELSAEKTVLREPEDTPEVQQLLPDSSQVSEETPKHGANKAATSLEKPVQKKKKKRSPKAAS
ncbi:beta-taxilin-like isoform X3 [Thalassophryne amazonica]|uniref:beta-taxilin-like isoform X3 n=1 Tax=Thalassophryne amazonica TaxID=390379 RepID=UPI001470E617|nr:beta-taxilin-like isoform X3 [Thalassophryne amazonica]